MKQLKLPSTDRPLFLGLLAYAAVSLPVLAAVALTQPQSFSRLIPPNFKIENLLALGERDLRLEPDAQACKRPGDNPSQTQWTCLGSVVNYKTAEQLWDAVYTKDSIGIHVVFDRVSGDTGRYDVQCDRRSVEFLSYLPHQNRDPKVPILDQTFIPPPGWFEPTVKMQKLPLLLKDRLLNTCNEDSSLPETTPSPVPSSVSAPSPSPTSSPSIVPIPPASAAP